MDQVEFDLMATLVHLGGCAGYVDIEAASGYHRTTFSAYNGSLIARGWLLHRSPWWLLTERGKIAFAIETGRRSRARFSRLSLSGAAGFVTCGGQQPGPNGVPEWRLL